MCTQPIIAYQRLSNLIDDKRSLNDTRFTKPKQILFRKPENMTNWKPIELACGTCLECRLAKASDWATRCYLENKYCEEAIFVTLTYRPEDVPTLENGEMTLKIKDLQDFFKRLLKKYPKQNIRRFWSAEYGEKNGRPHYHAIIFNYRPTDLKKLRKKSNRGQTIYTSKELEKLWEKGRVVIGNVTANSAGYVARYTIKKAGTEPRKKDIDWWKKVDNPKWIEWQKKNINSYKKCPYPKMIYMHKQAERKQKETCNCSRRPGIGLKYWEENKKELKQLLCIYVMETEKVKVKPLPKYFWNLWTKENWLEAQRAKYKIQKMAEEKEQKELARIGCDKKTLLKYRAESLAKRTASIKRNELFEIDLSTE